MSTPAIARLNKDHERRGLILDLIETEVSRFEHDGSADWPLLREISEFFSEYVNRFHHSVEDAILERMLRRDPGCKDLVNRVSMEHTGLNQETGLLNALLDHVDEDRDTDSRGRLVSAIRDFVAWNRIHMRHEETEIFPRAEALLRAEDWEVIDSLLPTPENDPLGPCRLPRKFPLLFSQLPP